MAEPCQDPGFPVIYFEFFVDFPCDVPIVRARCNNAVRIHPKESGFLTFKIFNNPIFQGSEVDDLAGELLSSHFVERHMHLPIRPGS